MTLPYERILRTDTLREPGDRAAGVACLPACLPSYGKFPAPRKELLPEPGQPPQRGLSPAHLPAHQPVSLENSSSSVLQGFDMKITLLITPAIFLIQVPRATGTRCRQFEIKQLTSLSKKHISSGDRNSPLSLWWAVFNTLSK